MISLNKTSKCLIVLCDLKVELEENSHKGAFRHISHCVQRPTASIFFWRELQLHEHHFPDTDLFEDDDLVRQMQVLQLVGDQDPRLVLQQAADAPDA